MEHNLWVGLAFISFVGISSYLILSGINLWQNIRDPSRKGKLGFIDSSFGVVGVGLMEWGLLYVLSPPILWEWVATFEVLGLACIALFIFLGRANK